MTPFVRCVDGVATTISGLSFAGNVNYPSASPSGILVWNQTLSGTIPLAAYPATYLWRAHPRSQVGANNYWTFLFHARWQTDTFNQETTNEYYGCHPYPDGATPRWEISSHGGDTFVDAVVFNQWYQQVVVTSQTGGNETITYYWNWPSTTNVVTITAAGRPAASDPAIIMGDAPWNQGFEIPNAILRAFQFYDTNLSTTQIAQELASPGVARTPWYLNLNPTPTDVTDKSGNSNDPIWFGTARPTLWEG